MARFKAEHVTRFTILSFRPRSFICLHSLECCLSTVQDFSRCHFDLNRQLKAQVLVCRRFAGANRVRDGSQSKVGVAGSAARSDYLTFANRWESDLPKSLMMDKPAVAWSVLISDFSLNELLDHWSGRDKSLQTEPVWGVLVEYFPNASTDSAKLPHFDFQFAY